MNTWTQMRCRWPWKGNSSSRNTHDTATQGLLTSKEEGRSLSTGPHHISELPEEEEEQLNQRLVHINDPAESSDTRRLVGNSIRTTKYHWYSFIPRNLFEQFRRLAYVFFLVIALLNQLPMLAVFGRAASLIPLASVVIISAIKDAFEDLSRHRSDKAENNRPAMVYHPDGFKPKKSKHVQVGDVVRVSANETIPCDMVLLATSDPSGVAYVETINLDGESNLKPRYAHQETLSRHPESQPVSGVLHCEHPHRDIYEFRGYLDLHVESGTRRFPLGPNNIILRGCRLKNTDWVVGVVVYAGMETKVMLNSSGAQSKRSKLERKMNRETVWFAVMVIILCVVGALGTGIWVNNHKDQLDGLPYYKRKYIGSDKDYQYYGVFGEAGFAFLSFIIRFQGVIPLALYISLEFARLGQTYFMVRDLEMYHEETDTRFECRALNINEDLGQINYVFSDKTGTLTENKMVFHTASVNGVKYENSRKEIDDDNFKRVNPELVQAVQDDGNTAVHDYLLVLAACHTVVAHKSGDYAGVEYQGESPDEQALVSAAASYGYRLVERTADYILIEVKGNVQRYSVLGIHQFDSLRKRMSVVVLCPDKTVKVLVKGADSHVLDIVRRSSEADARVFQLTKQHLHDLSWDGLRTLVIAGRVLSPPELQKWRKLYTEATTALVGRSEKLEAAAAAAENHLTLLGATGIEDKLQHGVPEAIAALQEAGIKVWVLTGDKQETAISIGFSSALLTHQMQQIIVNGSTKEECHEALAAAKAKHNALRENSPLALVIDGKSLVHALSSELEQEFFDVSVACQAVICCRLAPYQKADIVKLVRRKDNAITLSIGDGANDVAMIQAADIGVGICGQEGRQAVMASDYSMAQFRYIKRLLLVHGHWNHQRLCYMVLYNFYRTPVFTLMVFWYLFYTGFSASSAMTDWNAIFFSFYVCLPTIALGILDQEVSDKTLLEHPKLYGTGQRNEYYNQKLFWLTVLDTVWQSLVLFYIPYFTYIGSDLELYGLGNLWIISVVLLVNLHLAMDTHRWNWILHFCIWESILLTIACQLMMDTLGVSDFLPNYWSIYNIIGTASFWLNLLLISFIALLPRFLVKLVMHRCFPSDVRIAREAELLKKTSSARSPST